MPTNPTPEPVRKEGGADDQTPQAATISLPKGVGAVRAMGERFATNRLAVDGRMSVPIATSPGRLWFGPQTFSWLRLHPRQRPIRLGYGRFGTNVSADHAPWLDFSDTLDQGRVRLADINGSGTIDICAWAVTESTSGGTTPAAIAAMISRWCLVATL